MLKKAITYTDYNGKERTEDFYFNLSPMEAARISVKYPEGYQEHIKKVLDNDDKKDLLNMFEYLVATSYGEKTEDGKHFQKSDNIRDNFLNCPAYDALIMDISSNTKTAIDFFVGLFPPDMAKKIKDEMKKNPSVPEEVKNS